jgi:hypothetical protein
MMGQQTRTDSLFYYFRLEDQIPEHHLLRLIDSGPLDVLEEPTWTFSPVGCVSGSVRGDRAAVFSGRSGGRTEPGCWMERS